MERVIFRQSEGSGPRVAWAALVFLIALALRVTAAVVLGDLPISRTPQLDSAAYVSWARALVAEPSFWPEYPEHAPGYPIFMAAILAVSSGSLMAVRIAQALLGAIGCVLTARVAARTLTPKAFLPAGLLQAAYGPLIYIDTALLGESLLVFFLILTLDLATSARTRRHWIVCGLALGAAIVVRPTAIVLLPAFAIVIAIRHSKADALKLAAALTAGTLILVAPVVIQNWRVTGIPMVQAYAGLNVYLGNRPAGTGTADARLGGEWDALEGEASRFGSDRNAQDEYYLAKTAGDVVDAPGQYARLLGLKFVWTLQDEELRDSHSYYFFENAMPLLRWLPGFGVIAALAVAGVLVSGGSGRPWLAAYFVAMLLTIVLLVVGTRYRLPLLPALIALAGAGVAGLIERARVPDWRGAGMLGAVVVAAFALTNLWTHAPSRNLAEEYAFTGLSLLQEQQFEDAERTYRAAIAMDDSSFAWDGLGLVLLRRDLRRDALEAFQRAVQINEKNATAWTHLGVMYERVGNREAALDAYRRALAITPERAEPKDLLQRALLRP